MTGCFAVLLATLSSAPLAAQLTHNVRAIQTVRIDSIVQAGADVLGVDANHRTSLWNPATETWTLLGAPAFDGLAGAVFTTRQGRAFAYSSTGASEWNGQTWVSVALGGASPTADVGFSMTELPNGDVLLFGGGTSASAYFDETWLLSGTTWTQLAPANQPSARAGAALCASASGSVILFGGSDGVTTFDDTWRFSGGNWANLNLANPPSARTYAGLTYRPSTDTMTLIGGLDANAVGPADFASWFDGVSWNTVQGSISLLVDVPLVFGSAIDRQDQIIVSLPTEFVPGSPNLAVTIASSVAGWLIEGQGCFCLDSLISPFSVNGAGTPKPGSFFTIGFTRFAGGVPLFVAADFSAAAPVLPIAGFPAECTQDITSFANLTLVAAAPIGGLPAVFLVNVPNTSALVGTRVFYQGIQPPFGIAGCTSRVLDVHIGAN